MPSSFASVWNARQGALDNSFGEPLLIAHQVAGEFTQGGNDPSIPPFTATGILDVEGIVTDDSGLKTAARSEVETVKPVVDFAWSQFSSANPAPVKGTIITAVTRFESPRFEVIDRLPDGVGRVVFQLAPL